MIRVLHLRELAADYQTESGVDALLHDASPTLSHELRTLGRGGMYATTVAAILAMRRKPPVCEVMHAWGMTSLTVAAFGTAVNNPILFSPTEYPGARDVKWVRAVMGYRDVQVICPTDTTRRRFVERGVPIERCHLIRPGVAFAKVRRKRNDELRRALGLSTEDRAILAPGESTRDAAHRDALFAAAVLNLMDRRDRLLVWGRGAHSDALRRVANRLGRPVLVDAQNVLHRPIAFEELMSAADEVLITSRGPVPTLPIATCMAAALPTVAVVTETVSELLEDRHTALIVGNRSPRRIAQRILDLRADESRRWSIGDMARTEAYEFFSLTRFLQQHRAVYQQIASNQPVQVPHERPGAGLRFHGRA